MKDEVRALILDMDGVLWRGDAPIGDLPAIFARIRVRGLKVAFATNNGTRTPEQYLERLAGFGVTIQPWQVVTSSLALADLLYQHFSSLPQEGEGEQPSEFTAKNAKNQINLRELSDLRGLGVFAIGEEGVMTALREKGFKLLSVEEAEKAQAVVMGIDRQINFDKMREATLLVRRGVPFYATNPD
ncbi:MAG: hypothetical protein KJ606_13335, partial [Chloroflexi bacterium]|nr:hypothetical protein [Chloroflexota bacterium]